MGKEAQDGRAKFSDSEMGRFPFYGKVVPILSILLSSLSLFISILPSLSRFPHA